MTTERPPGASSGRPPSTTSPAVIAAAWLVVGIPAAWGVFQTGRQATALFQSSPAAPSDAATKPASAVPAAPSSAAPSPATLPAAVPAPPPADR